MALLDFTTMHPTSRYSYETIVTFGGCQVRFLPYSNNPVSRININFTIRSHTIYCCNVLFRMISCWLSITLMAMMKSEAMWEGGEDIIAQKCKNLAKMIHILQKVVRRIMDLQILAVSMVQVGVGVMAH